MLNILSLLPAVNQSCTSYLNPPVFYSLNEWGKQFALLLRREVLVVFAGAREQRRSIPPSLAQRECITCTVAVDHPSN
jgi:hypothetical protein